MDVIPHESSITSKLERAIQNSARKQKTRGRASPARNESISALKLIVKAAQLQNAAPHAMTTKHYRLFLYQF